MIFHLSFRSGKKMAGAFAAASFVLALVCLMLFILADKNSAKYRNCKEGLWQRLNFLFMYLPLAFVALGNLSPAMGE